MDLRTVCVASMSWRPDRKESARAASLSREKVQRWSHGKFQLTSTISTISTNSDNMYTLCRPWRHGLTFSRSDQWIKWIQWQLRTRSSQGLQAVAIHMPSIYADLFQGEIFYIGKTWKDQEETSRYQVRAFQDGTSWKSLTSSSTSSKAPMWDSCFLILELTATTSNKHFGNTQ